MRMVREAPRRASRTDLDHCEPAHAPFWFLFLSGHPGSAVSPPRLTIFEHRGVDLHWFFVPVDGEEFKSLTRRDETCRPE